MNLATTCQDVRLQELAHGFGGLGHHPVTLEVDQVPALFGLRFGIPKRASVPAGSLDDSCAPAGRTSMPIVSEASR